MLTHLDKYRILLGSGSPRRKELLRGLNIKFETTVLPDVDESYPERLKGEEIPLYIARKKAAAYLSQMEKDTLLITADTIVWQDGNVYGKPRNDADAIAMLKALSGKTHQVITGVVIHTLEKEVAFTVTSEVRFAHLTEEEIGYYVDRYHPLDKAGAYGVQEWIGFIGVENIEGSYYNIMGLPIQRLYQELKEF